MAPVCMVDDKVMERCDPIRVIAGADPTTGKIIEDDFASLGAQFRAGEHGFLTTVRRRAS